MAFYKVINWAFAVLGFCVMALFLFKLEQAFSATPTAEAAQQALQNFQISIWCGWLLITGPAIYFRWKAGNHILFIIDYLIAVTAFIIFGVYVNRGAELELWSLGDSFRGNVTFLVIRNILLICGMTAFIHAAIWWFSKRWHRR
ncbi:hypothetical protein APR41_13910 [Salegentibacter salinarum]|uniref:Uncharacterized protein n=1 Tax=Salegentibacter salinarum TaxID=447422 RepID=A0A2N0U041_9FLAO|nr:hypothetical protein [Salegentibacter salinarum]PKD20370.1 hypothetical protein APR41_13910 [Salegentibacter salinarum]SKB85565.1 hypothetical protein SAMN05660903_02907 [Salegentibacter salinarum]